MPIRSADLQLRVRQQAPIMIDAELDCVGGELLALVGPSGSGKSTLLRMIAGLTHPASGTIRLGEQCWFDSQKGVHLTAQERRVGYVPQHYGLFPHLSALANIEAGLGHLSPDQRHSLARAWLAKVNLGGLESRRPAELSGGQQQRVALARALAREPSVLLLDEPFSAVDRATRESLYIELAELKQELSLPIVMVTHDLSEALMLADRMTLLDHGRTLQSGDPRVVYARPDSVAVARLMGVSNILSGSLLRHDAATQRSWIKAGSLQLACRYQSALAIDGAVQWMLPERAIRLPSISGKRLPEGVNRVSLTILQRLNLGDGVRLTAQLPGMEAAFSFHVPVQLAQALDLVPSRRVEAVLLEEDLHLMEC